MDCVICGAPIKPERVALGKDICLNEQCVAQRRGDWGQEYRLMLVPKQGYTLVRKDDPALLYGKSSGRS